MARAQQINDIIRASADKLEEVDAEREITPILSYLDVLFTEMEERVVKQVQAKCEAIHKVARLKAQNEK